MSKERERVREKKWKEREAEEDGIVWEEKEALKMEKMAEALEAETAAAEKCLDKVGIKGINVSINNNWKKGNS